MRPHIIAMLITAAMAAVCASGADSTLLAATYCGFAPKFLAHIRGAIATDTRRSA